MLPPWGYYIITRFIYVPLSCRSEDKATLYKVDIPFADTTALQNSLFYETLALHNRLPNNRRSVFGGLHRKDLPNQNYQSSENTR